MKQREIQTQAKSKGRYKNVFYVLRKMKFLCTKSRHNSVKDTDCSSVWKEKVEKLEIRIVHASIHRNENLHVIIFHVTYIDQPSKYQS